MNLQLQGTITSWNDDKGYGFITPLSGGDRIFVHIKAFKNRNLERPQLNKVVYYSMSKDKQGRPCATDVTYYKQKQNSQNRSAPKPFAIIFITLFFALLCILTFVTHTIPVFIIGLYAGASAITYIAYALDKSAAKQGQWRTAESTLQGMSLFCGWPGALLAQQILRHKSKKEEFQGVFKITVFLNITITAWLLTPNGPERTHAFLEKLVRLIEG